MRTAIILAACAVLFVLAGCPGGTSGDGVKTGPAAGPSGPAAADGTADAPANRWVMRNPDGPNIIWENGIAWDPATQLLVWYGGHASGYPQSNYTHLYDPKSNTWRDSQAPYRPQRRCLVMVNYLDSCGKVACMQGGSGHGSIPEGGFDAEYKRIVKTDPRGPWLYDVAADRWESCRPLPPIWKRVSHAQCAYDVTSDALVWITGDKLGLYCPRTNRCVYRELPKELTNRLAYGIAADPVRRKIVVFGGTGPQAINWIKTDKAEGYKTLVHNDTWLYDVATDTWKQALPKTVPPKGMPLFDHRFIPMVYHDRSGTILMQQTPLDKYEPDTAKWPATQFWSFDVATEQWTLLAMENTPPFQGLLAYAADVDLLFLVGGGKDGVAKDDDGKAYLRPSLSKQLWTCRAEVPSKRTRAVEPSTRKLVVTALTSPDQPWRPGGLLASVESAKKVVLRWNPNKETDLVGYNVYRATGKEIEAAKGTKLNDKPVAAQPGAAVPQFTDTAVDLSDGVARIYWVTAVNKAGLESGASPLAYTFPDAPLALKAVKAADGKTITVTWDWPAGVKIAGVNVYQINNHLNTHGEPAEVVKAWFESWKKVNDQPVADGKLVFAVPAGEESKHHYFYLRAVNVLGQEGLYSDLCSATDKRFRP